jgi:hypothetical protein
LGGAAARWKAAAAHRGLVEAAQQRVVEHVRGRGDRRGVAAPCARRRQRAEQEVHRDAPQLELDDGRERVRDGQQLRDVGPRRERAAQAAEEVGARDVRRREEEHVDVRARGLHVERARAEEPQRRGHSPKELGSLAFWWGPGLSFALRTSINGHHGPYRVPCTRAWIRAVAESNATNLRK